MGLELTHNRDASHFNLAVAGSPTQVFLDLKGRSSDTISYETFLRWSGQSGQIPKFNARGTFSPTWTYNSEKDYWSYYDLGSEPPELWAYAIWQINNDNTVSMLEYDWGITGDALASVINGAPQNHGSNCFWAIWNDGQTDMTPNLYDSLIVNGSWMYTSVSEGSASRGQVESRYMLASYAAVGTPTMGVIAESIQGPGTGSRSIENARIQLPIETDNKIGHAGYGPDQSHDIGNGTVTSSGNTSLHVIDSYTRTSSDIWLGNYSAQDHGPYYVKPGEYIRVSFEAKVDQTVASTGGYVGIRITEQGQTPVTYTVKPVDGMNKFEYLHRKSSNAKAIKYDIIGHCGSGGGTVTIQDLEIYKCGYNPEQSRDVVSHAWHINALNVVESTPANFDVADASQFLEFWNSDRNLVSKLERYDLSTANSSLPLENYITNRGDGPGSSLNYKTNWTHFFHQDLKTTSTLNAGHFMHETRRASVNTEINVPLGWDPNAGSGYLSPRNQSSLDPLPGIIVDRTKVHVFGVWVRVRDCSSGTTSGVLPRIQVLNRAVRNDGYAHALVATFGDGNSGPVGGHVSGSAFPTHSEMNLATNSITSDYLIPDLNKWKLVSSIYLPNGWVPSTTGLDWLNDYWAKWAGQYEFSEGNPDGQMSGDNVGGGFERGSRNTLRTDSLIAGVNSMWDNVHGSVAALRPIIRAEIPAGETLWFDVAYPFLTEVDPMNINADGTAFFWNFSER